MSAVARSPGPPNLLYESPSLDREVGPAAPIARTSSLKRPAPPNIDVEIKNAMTHAIRLLPEVKDWCADPELILVPPESENVPIVRGYACALLQGKRDGVSVNLVFPRADVSEMCRLIGHMQKVARIAVTRGLRVVVRSAEDEVQAWRTQMGRIQEDLRHIEEEQARKAYMDDLCIYDGAAADSMAKLEAIRGLAPDDLLGVGSSPLRQEVPSP